MLVMEMGKNVLSSVQIRTKNELASVHKVCDSLVNPSGDRVMDHWSKCSHRLLTGTVLHLFYVFDVENKGIPLLGDLVRLFHEKNIQDILQEMMCYPHFKNQTGSTLTHPEIKEIAEEFINKMNNTPNEMESIVSTVVQLLKQRSSCTSPEEDESEKSPQEKFKRTANKQTNELIKRIRLIGNLANQTKYSYENEQVEKIFSAIRKEVDKAETKFKEKEEEKEEFVLE